MKKLFNPRPFFLFALCFSGGLAFGLRSLTAPSLTVIWIVVGAVLVFSFFTILLKSKRFGAWAVCGIFFLVGAGVFSLEIRQYENRFVDTSGTVTGVATDKIYIDGEVVTFYIRDVSLQSAEGNFDLAGYTRVKMAVALLPSDLRAGDKVQFEGHIQSSDLFLEGEIFTYYYKNKINYIVKNGSVANFSSEAGRPSLTESIRQSVKTVLYDTLGTADGAILYSLLFGDKTDMDPSTQADFVESGIIHVFAVSGMHVGFLSLVLLWILDKLKVKRKTSFFIQMAVFALYAALCDFSPSVTRAAIMALVLQGSYIFFRRYDLLSSIGFSALIILIFRPLLLFDVGFLYTYGCMFGIATVFPFLQKSFVRLPKFLRTPLSMSISVQLALLPLSAHFFGTLSLFGVLFNIVAVPLVAVSYILLLPLVTLSLIFGFVAPLLNVPSFAISLLRLVSKIVASSGMATILVTGFGLMAAGFYLVLYIGRYMLVKRDLKTVICLGLCLLFFALTVFVNIPQPPSLKGLDTLTVVQHQNSSAAIVTTSQNQTFLVLSGGNKEIVDGVQSAAQTYSISAFDAVIFCEVSLESAAVFEQILASFSVDKAILPFAASMPPLDTAYYLQVEATGIDITYVGDIDQLNILRLGEVSLCYLGKGVPLALSLSLGGANILFLNSMDSAALDFTFIFAPSEPALVICGQNFSRVLEHYSNALVLFDNWLYNYFDTIIPSWQSEGLSPLTLKIQNGTIIGKRI